MQPSADVYVMKRKPNSHWREYKLVKSLWKIVWKMFNKLKNKSIS